MKEGGERERGGTEGGRKERKEEKEEGREEWKWPDYHNQNQ